MAQMRPSQKNRGSRNKGGRNKPVGNVASRVYESAGPEGKVRGTPQQIIDKYLLLARDAQTSGDRVVSENFLQHAEHYIRLLSAAQAQAEERRREAQARQEQEGDGARDENSFQQRDESDRDESDRGEQERAGARRENGGEARPAGRGDANGLATFGDDDDMGPVATPEGRDEGASRPNGSGRRRRRAADDADEAQPN